MGLVAPPLYKPVPLQCGGTLHSCRALCCVRQCLAAQPGRGAQRPDAARNQHDRQRHKQPLRGTDSIRVDDGATGLAGLIADRDRITRLLVGEARLHDSVRAVALHIAQPRRGLAPAGKFPATHSVAIAQLYAPLGRAASGFVERAAGDLRPRLWPVPGRVLVKQGHTHEHADRHADEQKPPSEE